MELLLIASNLYSIKELSTSSVAFILSPPRSSLSVLLSSGGIDGFRRARIVLSAGRKLSEKFRAGAGIEYLNIRYGRDLIPSHHAGFSLGMTFHPDNKLMLGAVIRNPFPGLFHGHWIDPVSTFMLGVCYLPFKGISLFLETEKSTYSPLMLKLAIESAFDHRFFLRLGYCRGLTFGWGFGGKRIKADLAGIYHRFLGFSSFVSLTYYLREGSP